MAATGCTVTLRTPIALPSLPPLPGGVQIQMKPTIEAVPAGVELGWITSVGQYHSHIHNGAKFQHVTWRVSCATVEVVSISNGIQIYKATSPIVDGLSAAFAPGQTVSYDATMDDDISPFVEVDKDATEEMWKPLKGKGLSSIPNTIGSFFKAK